MDVEAISPRILGQASAPHLCMSGWAQGRMALPRRLPYFITQLGPSITQSDDGQIDSCLCSYLLELTGTRQIQVNKTASITQDGTAFPTAQRAQFGHDR